MLKDEKKEVFETKRRKMKKIYFGKNLYKSKKD